MSSSHSARVAAIASLLALFAVLLPASSPATFSQDAISQNAPSQGAASQDAAGQSVENPSKDAGEKGYRFFDLDADAKEKIHVRGYFWGMGVPQRVLLMAPEGFGASIYFNPNGGQPGWAEWFAEHHWSVFALDLPGCGKSLLPKNPDIMNLSQAAVEATYRAAMVTYPQVVYAQGLMAAFVIKLRSTSPDAASGAILVDPAGPRGIQPLMETTPEEIEQRYRHLEDRLWVEWGIGPRPETVYPHSDLGKAGFDRLLAQYDRDAPPYWATVFTGLETWMQIPDPKNIAAWPVLVVRGPHPTPEMDAHRKDVVLWLTQHGAQVEEMDLGQEGPKGLSNLPMAGSLAPQAASFFLEWMENLPSNPRLKNSSSKP